MTRVLIEETFKDIFKSYEIDVFLDRIELCKNTEIFNNLKEEVFNE